MPGKARALAAAGILLLTAAAGLCAFNLISSKRAEVSSRQVLMELKPEEKPRESQMPEGPESEAEPEPEPLPDYILDPNMEMPWETIDGQDYIAVLKIPALELELPVIRQWSYAGLKIAPCRYTGSAYLGNMVIAAHNYASHFGKLDELRQGDAVQLTDMDGNVFSYEVVELEVLSPYAIEEMTSGDWDLTLFTCTLGGSTRVTVRCAASGGENAGI